MEAKAPRYQHIFDVSEDPPVSADIIGNAHAAVVDLDLPRVVDGTLVKIMAWYDNEWGFTHQMVRAARPSLDIPHPVVAMASPEAPLDPRRPSRMSPHAMRTPSTTMTSHHGTTAATTTGLPVPSPP